MKNLYSLQELKKVIDDDKKTNIPSYVRYPLRFIFIRSYISLRELINTMKNEGISLIELKDYLPYDDGWITSDNILNTVKKINKDTIIVSLSEILSFFNAEDYCITVNNLVEIESKNNIRIYIPLIGQLERFETEFWNNFYRKELWAPIWILEENKPSKIIIYQMYFHVENLKIGRKILNSKEWLDVWKTIDTSKIISFSNVLEKLVNNFVSDSIIDLKKINNYKEFLEVLYDLIIPINYKDTEIEYWKTLVSKIINRNEYGVDLEKILLYELNLRVLEDVEIEDFFKIYIESKNDFEKWLLKHFLVYYDKYQKSYLIKILNKMHSLDNNELIALIWFDIFDSTYEDKFFNERKYIVELLQNSTDFLKDVDLIKEIYPALFHYLNWEIYLLDSPIDEWIIDYFKYYNKSKILNKKESFIDKLLNEKNKNKETFCEWYYKIDGIKEEIDDKIWIDGLGAEWFPLLSYFIEKYGKMYNKVIEKKLIVKVNLPSITECNNYDGAEKIGDLDEYIHRENPYKFPDDLVKEIETLENVVKKIMDKNNKSMFSVVSDHGFSFLSQKLYNNIKKMNFNANHDGRCVWIDKNIHYNDDDYFIEWETEKGNCCGKRSIIATKHISLQNVPKREVHGGSTPEEILVPYIVIKQQIDKIEYTIKPDTFKIFLKNPVIYLTIAPNPRYIPKLVFKNMSFELNFNSLNNNYCSNLSTLKTGKHTLNIEIGNKKYTINVEIQGGFEEKELI